jgi:uncharacterized protein (TIGR02246 family)
MDGMTNEDEIRELQSRWGQRHAEKDVDGWLALFAEDGKYINPRGGEIVGRAALRDYFTERFIGSERNSTHVFGFPIVRVDGDRAELSTDYISCHRDGDKAGTVGQFGCVINRLVRTGGQWYIAEYRIVNHPDPLPAIDK